MGNVLAWNRPLGRAIRAPLRLLDEQTVLPILAGPNRGLKWTIGAGNHGCWLGTYERPHATLLSDLTKPGMTAIDAGANGGYFTLLFARAVGARGQVLAFEPAPHAVKYLRANVILNGLDNVTVMEAALAEARGTLAFKRVRQTEGHLASDGDLMVQTFDLDSLPHADIIKMDIEGGETAALKGAARLIARRRTTWLIELHVPAASVIVETFAAHGYHVQRLDCAILARPDD